MPKGFFKVGDVWLNPHLVTKVVDWPAGVVSIHWDNGDEGGDGVAVHQYPNSCSTFSEKHLQEHGWADRFAFIDDLGRAVSDANG